MNPSHVRKKSWGYTTIQSSSEPKEPPEINMNLSKEGSKYIPTDMEHYEIHVKDTTHFSLISVRTGCQQQLSLAQGMFQVMSESTLKTCSARNQNTNISDIKEAALKFGFEIVHSSPNPKGLTRRTECNIRELTPRLSLIDIILLYSIVSTFLQV